jgi:hypothetical protein
MGSIGEDYAEWKRLALERDLEVSRLRTRAETAEAKARDLQAKLSDYMRADAVLTLAAESWKTRAEQAEGERAALAEDLAAVRQSAEFFDRAANEERKHAERAKRERDALREAFRGAAPDTYEAVVESLAECLDDGPRMAMAKHARQMETRAREEKAARERAEADNAAAAELLVQLFPKEHRDTWIVWLHEEGCRAARDDNAKCTCEGDEYEERIRSVIEAHPGAALLERLRALEKVRELLKDGVMGGHIKLIDRCQELSDACAAADALKGPTCSECGMAGTHKLQCGRRE